MHSCIYLCCFVRVIYKIKHMNIRRLKAILFLNFQQTPWLSRSLRARFVSWGGVKFQSLKGVRIGQGCVFDTTNPQDIVIEEGAHIALRCIIITHFKNPRKLSRDTASGGYDRGKVVIKKNAWIGASTVITKPLTIGEGAIIGACSVLTRDVPDYEVWAGNPAKFIRKR